MRILNRILLGAVVATAMALPRPADASPLNLTLDEFPDILSQFIDVNYSADLDVLVAQGFSLQISLGPGATLDIVDGTFNIGIFTDGMTASGPAGDHLLITGSLDLSDPTDGIIDFSGVLLTGRVAQFGASAGGPGAFEFVFDITGGLLTGLFPNGQAGVILGAGAGSNYTGSFDLDFSNTGGIAGAGTGSADTAPIPEPGTLLLIGAGIAGLAGFGRRERC